MEQEKDARSGTWPIGHERQRNMYGVFKKNIKSVGKAQQLKELMDEEGNILKADVDCIERTWKGLLNTEGDAAFGVMKEGAQMERGDEEITRAEVDAALKNLKNGKAMDETEMCGEYLKALKTGGVEEVRRKLNEILRTGEVPDEWKKSRVVLLHKGGERRNIKNYRLVSISAIMYKVMMMIVRGRMEKWIESNGLLSETQGGFRRRRRTEDNIFVSKVRGGKMLIACLDLEKAYDRVNRRKLFEVLEMMGLDHGLLRLLKGVYQGNEVRFVLGKWSTNWVPCTSGVRQGCPLSPLLFNIYM
jgi:hypothetical protein